MPRGLKITILSLLGLSLAAGVVTDSGFSPRTAPVVYLAAVTPWLVTTDVREHRLPNVLVVPGIGIGLAGVAGQWALSGRIPVVPLLAGSVYAGFLLLLNLLGGIGMGDVKLGAALGLGSWNLPTAVLSPTLAFLAGGVLSVVLLIAGRRGRRIPFGPFLLGGFWAVVALVGLSRP